MQRPLATIDRPPSIVRPATLMPLVVAFLAWGLSNMDQSLFGYAVPGLMRDLHLSLSQVSLIISASFACSIVVSIVVGVLTDRWGAPVTLPACLAISALLVGLQGLAPDAASFGLLRIAGYGFSGALAPITNTMTASASPPKWRAVSVAVLQCAYPLGWFVASLVGAPMLAHGGWRPMFMLGFVVLPAALIFYLALRRGQAAPGPRQQGQRAPLSDLFSPEHRRKALVLGLAFILYGGAVGGTTFYLPTFFHAARGYSEATAAHIVGLSYGIGVFGYVGAALVSEFLMTRRATVITWLLVGAAGFGAMVWLPRSEAQDVALFGVTTLFFYGASAILVIYLLELFPENLRGTASAVSGTACIGAGFMIFPLLTARAVEVVGWKPAFTAVAAPPLIIAALLVSLLPVGGGRQMKK